MAAYIANVYGGVGVGTVVVAASTPSDGIANNLLIGSRGSDLLYGESGNSVTNEMYGLRGDDVMTGGFGVNIANVFIGGAGVDKAVIPYFSGNLDMFIDYQGGVTLTRLDGGSDIVNSETEIIEFTGGNRFIVFSGGSEDLSSETTWIQWQSGDRITIGQDWLNALGSGLVSPSIYDVDGNGSLDTVLTGHGGINTYVLLGYDLAQHDAQVVGVYGEGILFDLA